MKKLIALSFTAVILSACSPTQPSDTNIETFTVGPEYKDCVGVGPQKCLVVNGNFFYSNIEGFNYEEGYEYALKVEKTERENTPADASKYIYKLVEITDKKAVNKADSDKIIGTWHWSEAKNDNEFVATFTEDSFSSTTDCNNLFGSYTITDSELSFGNLASTKKACLNETMEQQYVQMLSKVESYKINESILTLNLSADESMIFNKK